MQPILPTSLSIVQCRIMLLGISPGTQCCGYAVMRRKELIVWGNKTFKGKWSDKKLKKILHCLSNLIETQGIQRVAIKIPDILPNSKRYNQLIGALNVLFEQYDIPVSYYSLSDLKEHYSKQDGMNKTTFMELITADYAELVYTCHKGKRNHRTRYYIRLFEAVATAHVLSR